LRFPHLNQIIGLIFIGVVYSLTGCVSDGMGFRKQGFLMFHKDFVSAEETPNLHEIIELKNVRVHIVGSREYFNWDRAAAYGSPVLGYANTKNEIWIFGRRVEDKIIINQAIIGHELNHLLNFKNPKIANPDTLDESGG